MSLDTPVHEWGLDSMALAELAGLLDMSVSRILDLGTPMAIDATLKVFAPSPDSSRSMQHSARSYRGSGHGGGEVALIDLNGEPTEYPLPMASLLLLGKGWLRNGMPPFLLNLIAPYMRAMNLAPSILERSIYFHCPLPIDRLRTALQDVMDAYPELRTRLRIAPHCSRAAFLWFGSIDDVAGVAPPGRPPPLTVLEAGGVGWPAYRRKAIWRLARSIVRPDDDRFPLVDFCFERDSNVLHVLLDHVICDGGAMGTLCRAIAEACAGGKSQRRPRQGYVASGDYATWQRSMSAPPGYQELPRHSALPPIWGVRFLAPFSRRTREMFGAVPLASGADKASPRAAFMACWMATIWRTTGFSKMVVDNAVNPRSEAWVPQELVHTTESLGNLFAVEELSLQVDPRAPLAKAARDVAESLAKQRAERSLWERAVGPWKSVRSAGWIFNFNPGQSLPRSVQEGLGVNIVEAPFPTGFVYVPRDRAVHVRVTVEQERCSFSIDFDTFHLRPTSVRLFGEMLQQVLLEYNASVRSYRKWKMN